MVFPHGQPSCKKKSKIGYQDKKGNSYADYQKAVAAAGEDVGETEKMTPTLPFQSHKLLLRYHGPIRIGQMTIKLRGH